MYKETEINVINRCKSGTFWDLENGIDNEVDMRTHLNLGDHCFEGFNSYLEPWDVSTEPNPNHEWFGRCTKCGLRPWEVSYIAGDVFDFPFLKDEEWEYIQKQADDKDFTYAIKHLINSSHAWLDNNQIHGSTCLICGLAMHQLSHIGALDYLDYSERLSELDRFGMCGDLFR